MKALSNFHPQYGKNDYDFDVLGEIVYEVDTSQSYEEDEAKLIKNHRRYTMIAATGCSCWDGDWEGWTDMTKAEVKKLAKSWMKDYQGSASRELGEWVDENL